MYILFQKTYFEVVDVSENITTDVKISKKKKNEPRFKNYHFWSKGEKIYLNDLDFRGSETAKIIEKNNK